MIDIHSHILPNVDDGADNMDMSLEMARIYVNNGINTVIATPHYVEGVRYSTVDDLRINLEAFKKELVRAGIPIDLYLGNEIFASPDIVTQIKEDKVATLNDSRYVLVEFPMNELPLYVEDLIYELSVRGYVPIIAHPERYTRIVGNPNILYRYINMGALTQMNLPSLVGLYGAKVKTTAEVLLDHNMIHFVGTDAHSDRKRSPNVEKALDLLYDKVGKETYNLLTFTNPTFVLENKIIKIHPPKEYKKKNGFMSLATLFAKL